MTNLKRKNYSAYDKSTLDAAVHMVLQNKLSIRAAAHIYKIPFSTLRTRKICKVSRTKNIIFKTINYLSYFYSSYLFKYGQ